VESSAIDAGSPVQLEALRGYWHPVAWSEEVTEQPLAVRLLDQPLVLWRAADGVAAFYDLCIHRGTPLSLGWVSDGQLVCAYHGWSYAPSGACTRIPSLPAERGIPSKARATAYQVEERYGLVWVCLGEPRAEIPTFPPELKDPDYRWREQRDGFMGCNAARFVENMMDTSHFAWVHPGVLGVPEQAEVAEVEISELDGGFQYWTEEPVGGTMMEPERPIQRHYECWLPFMILFRGQQPWRPERQTIWFVCSPISTKETRYFQFSYFNYERSDAQVQRARLIGEQDRRIVESQRPEELPLDLSEELHLRGPDRASLEYRRRLRQLGITWE
jgi:phenylpropionate dioxygenase-like ring-hydroxylating dioxygenase large terminal subunit